MESQIYRYSGNIFVPFGPMYPPNERAVALAYLIYLRTRTKETIFIITNQQKQKIHF